VGHFLNFKLHFQDPRLIALVPATNQKPVRRNLYRPAISMMNPQFQRLFQSLFKMFKAIFPTNPTAEIFITRIAPEIIGILISLFVRRINGPFVGLGMVLNPSKRLSFPTDHVPVFSGKDGHLSAPFIKKSEYLGKSKRVGMPTFGRCHLPSFLPYCKAGRICFVGLANC